MTKLCYLGVLSTVVLYLAFYLVLSFLVHICYCPRRKMILLWLKNLVMITIFYVLIYKKRVLFSQYRRYQIGKSFWLISTHHVAASFDTKRKKNWFPKKNSRFWNPQTWKLCINVKFCSTFELLYCDDLLLEVRFVNFHAYFGGLRHHRSSRPEVFCEKGLRPATLLRRRLWHRCVPVNIAKFIKTPFLTEHLRWLLLTSVLVSFRTFNFCVFDEIKKIFAE